MMENLIPAKKIYSVSELAENINQILETEFKDIWVQGEISGFRKYKTGHFFFSLKDEKSLIPAIMFRFHNIYLKFQPEDGLEVVARGYLNFYRPRGELKLIVDWMEPVGIGALQIAFEQLKKKLEQEGLFDKARKKPIPEFCRRIALITSPTGAVLHDILKIFRQRKTRIEILLIPSRVQGEGAEMELAQAITLAQNPELASQQERAPLDLILLARGGGSLEDLLPFNTETVARAIANSKIPVISAIGHEIDYTIADFVADERAPTPTAAAEMIARAQESLLMRLENLETKLLDTIQSAIAEREDALMDFADNILKFQDTLRQMDQKILLYEHQLRDSLWDRIRTMKDRWIKLSQSLATRSPDKWLQKQQSEMLKYESRILAGMQNSLNQNRVRLTHLVASLQSLSPLSTLERGYCIARKKSDLKTINDQNQVEIGDSLELILHRGELGVKVEEKKEKNIWEQNEPDPSKNQE